MLTIIPHTVYGFAVYDRTNRFFSAYHYGQGPHTLFISIKNLTDCRQVINCYTGMTDKFYRV